MAANKNRPLSLLFKLLYSRLLLPMLLLLMTLLVFVILFLYQSQHAYLEVIHKNQTDKLQHIVEGIEQDFHTIQNVQYRLISTETMDKLRFFYTDSDYYTRYSLILSMQKSLQQYVEDYRYVANARIYFYKSGLMISDKNVVHFNLPDAQKIEEQYTKDVNRFSYADGRLFIVNKTTTYSSKNRNVLDTDSLFIMEADKNMLLDNLKYITVNPEDIILVIDPAKRQTLLNPDNFDVQKLKKDKMGDIDGHYSIIKSQSDYLGWDIYYLYYNLTIYSYFQHFAVLLYVFLACVVAAILIDNAIWYFGVYSPLRLLLVDAFKNVEEGNLKYRIRSDTRSKYYILYESFNKMVEKLDYYVENDLKQKLLVSRANLKQLQAQISPHFMYNSYYLLYRLIKMGDMENSVKYSEYLGKFFQYITRNDDDEKRLFEEVEYANAYAAIQQFRFRDQVSIEFSELPGEMHNIYVPRLIIQPLLENAFKYAFDNMRSQEKLILRMRYQCEGNGVYEIIVENSGHIDDALVSEIKRRLGMPYEHTEFTALTNIHHRLGMYFGKDSGIRICRSDLGGLSVHLHIQTKGE